MNTIIHSTVIIDRLSFTQAMSEVERDALYADGYTWDKGTYVRVRKDARVIHAYEKE